MYLPNALVNRGFQDGLIRVYIVACVSHNFILSILKAFQPQVSFMALQVAVKLPRPIQRRPKSLRSNVRQLFQLEVYLRMKGSPARHFNLSTGKVKGRRDLPFRHC
jgi:hypothetical protein